MEKIIRSILSNKAPGYDIVTASVLRDSLPATISIITNPINNPYYSNTFAKEWKAASDEPSYTRPISLLPVISKVCQRSSHSQFVDYLQSKGIIVNYKAEIGKFTQRYLPYFISPMILRRIWTPKKTLVVILEMFIIKKLGKMGVSVNTLAWFESYLSQLHRPFH